MAKTHNYVTILGNVGSDPEVRETSTGKKVATLSVATSPPWNDNETNWHRVVAWEKVAEIVEKYVKKGDMIFVTGRISYRQWEGDDGQTRYSTEIVVRDLTLLGKRSRPAKSEPSQQAMGAPEDLPF